MRLHTLREQIKTVPQFNREFFEKELKFFNIKNKLNLDGDELISYVEFLILEATNYNYDLQFCTSDENVKEQLKVLKIILKFILTDIKENGGEFTFDNRAYQMWYN